MADRSGRTRRKQAAPPRGAGKAADTGDALLHCAAPPCETRIAQCTVASYWIRMSESRVKYAMHVVAAATAPQPSCPRVFLNSVN